MNAFNQDETVQNEGLAGRIDDAENGQVAERTNTQRLDNGIWLSGNRTGSHAVKQGAASETGELLLGGIYRTRWIAWTVIAAGWICSIAATVLRGGAVEWFLAAVLSGIIITSGLAPVIAAAGLTAVRSLTRQETGEGGQVEVQLTLKRSYCVPLVWVALRDETVNESSIAKRGISFRTVFGSLLRKESTIRYTLRKLYRGRHPYSHVSVTVGDWLGLTAIHKRIESRAEFVVLPGLPQTGDIGLGDRRGDADAGSPESRLAGAAPDARGAAGREEIIAAVRAAGIGPDSRPYREGDSLRHLDWRSAAKGRGLYTRIHSLEQPNITFIAIDSAVSAYDLDDRLFDACVGWAALAVKQAAALGSAVTLLTAEGMTVTEQSACGEMRGGTSAMLRRMALLRADGKGSMAGSLVKDGYTLTRGGTILVFTADWRGGRNWGELAGYAAEQGCRQELFIVTRNSVPSFAMREQQKWLEAGGVKVTWLYVPPGMSELPYAEEGGDAHEYA
ncbi:DUF58 domain-containing protein [Paenibacillus alkaliterrae]|uniref:DUF58 domain-containing protein n=1 Tax=Paenibacillus alkaliterrae TaxID=320909 RepID=UPI001F1D5588|nr:DUF58 domain-containing protein [Paenibacillus alkaliterrae]MCF2940536.1 DUF58 domain-containing protein [Paenibacillus alkaliterrae]